MSGECDRCGEHAVECECHKRTPTMTIGDKVQKIKGYRWPGVIVADFTTLSGQRRLVVECTAEAVAGALHIYNEDQLEMV